MKLSEHWLREWVNPRVSVEQLTEQLTMAGLEVDDVEHQGVGLEGILVGKILEAVQHPNADKLQVCDIDIGGETLSIICGAPNARKGLFVAVAVIGCQLPNGMKIKKAKLRGVESQGMLCSESELGFSEESDGILELPESVTVGQTLIEALQLNDVVIDVDLTPNRGDCLSIRGIAREVGVLNQIDVSEVSIDAVEPKIDDVLNIELSAPEACPRYVGRVIKGINAEAQTPEWMKRKLEVSGIRAIEPAVDVTNYVLLELGHPLHAFDLANLSGGIRVRWANTDETLSLLDGQEVKLSKDTLVIADEEKALAIAGVMGGKFSGISCHTTDIFLESAFFQPQFIAGKARTYGLHSDAAHRFERGVDFELQVLAIERATQLLLDIVGGQPGLILDVKNTEAMPSHTDVVLRRHRIERLLGIELDDDTVTDILIRLGMQLTPQTDGWTVSIPSYRFDIALEEDLIEELVRIYGYHNVPAKKAHYPLNMIPQRESQVHKRQLRQLMVDRGYQEAITYSFVEPKMQATVNPEIPSIALLNPISSELSDMRTSLWTGLLNAARYNLNRQQDRIRLFEIGLRFENHANGLQQIPSLAAVISGFRQPAHWFGKRDSVDFYDMKGDLQALLKLSGTESGKIDFKSEVHPALHPGQSARVYKNGIAMGWVGRLHPEKKKALDLEKDCFLFEVDFDMINQKNVSKFVEMSKFPSIVRDLAVIVDEEINASQLIDLIRQTGKNLLKHIHVFDVYRGEGVTAGRKSIALTLHLQHSSRTLEDVEVNQLIDKILMALNNQYNAVLRD